MVLEPLSKRLYVEWSICVWDIPWIAARLFSLKKFIIRSKVTEYFQTLQNNWFAKTYISVLTNDPTVHSDGVFSCQIPSLITTSKDDILRKVATDAFAEFNPTLLSAENKIEILLIDALLEALGFTNFSIYLVFQFVWHLCLSDTLKVLYIKFSFLVNHFQ